MQDFTLDPRLAQDCHRLLETEQGLLLLMNNRLAPWFILVPRTAVSEFHHLPPPQQILHLQQIDKITRRIEERLAPDKINIAAIGNIVRQLHIHIIARYEGDYAWPGVVWGRPEREPWEGEKISEMSAIFADLGL